MPLSKQVKFTLQSKDVLHDFWVPAFRMKKDVVPGIDVTYTVTPNLKGAYPIVCAELCGLGHAVMRATATVEDQGDVRGVADQPRQAGRARRPAAAAAVLPPRPTARRSSRPRTPTAPSATRSPTQAPTARSDPNLDKVLAGKDDAFIKDSIVDPSKEIAAGFQDGIMPPNYGDTLQPAQIDGLVKYLSEVTKGG